MGKKRFYSVPNVDSFTWNDEGQRKRLGKRRSLVNYTRIPRVTDDDKADKYFVNSDEVPLGNENVGKSMDDFIELN